VKTLIDVGSGRRETELGVAGSGGGVDVDAGGRVDPRGPHAVLLQRLTHVQVLEEAGGVTITRKVNIVLGLENVLQVVQLDQIEALFQCKVTEGIVIVVIDQLHALHVDIDVLEGVDVGEAPVPELGDGVDIVERRSQHSVLAGLTG